LRLYKKLWKKLKAKLRPKDPFKVSFFDKAIVQEAYHMRQEFIKSVKLSDNITHELLEEELSDCFVYIKNHLKTVLKDDEWVELENLPMQEFFLAFSEKNLNRRVEQLENKVQLSRAIKRIIQIEGLKQESKNNLRAETYYKVILNAYALKQVNGFIYIAVQKMMNRSRDKMYALARDNALNIAEAEQKILKEIALILEEEMINFKESLKQQKSPLIVGVEIDSDDVMQILIELNKIPLLLRPANLVKYIEKIRKGVRQNV
jgi:hypothetical protein